MIGTYGHGELGWHVLKDPSQLFMDQKIAGSKFARHVERRKAVIIPSLLVQVVSFICPNPLLFPFSPGSPNLPSLSASI